MKENNPLVSVVVTTFNAARYVRDTLNSVKAQSYSPIELIVSDDGSTDNTVSEVEQWLNAHKARFNHTAVVTVPINTGVSANCNRSIKAASSPWVKFIAGDDILFPNCIADNMTYAGQHPEAHIIFSTVKIYKDSFDAHNYVRTVPDQYPYNIMDPAFTPQDQYKRLLVSDRINFTPSFFFKKAAIERVGGYDEANQWVEDYPMWLKLTRAGIRLHYFNTPTVGYRQHNQAFNNVRIEPLVKPSMLKLYPFRNKYVLNQLPWDLAWSERWRMSFAFLFNWLNLNRKTGLLQGVFDLFTVYANPFQYLSYIKKKILPVDPVMYSIDHAKTP